MLYHEGELSEESASAPFTHLGNQMDRKAIVLSKALTSKRQKGKNNGEGTCAFPFFDQENAP